MTQLNITGNDTLTLNSRVIVNYAFDDVSVIAFPNKLVDAKTGKNGNTVYALNSTGFNATLTLKLMRGSPDDIFLRNLIAGSTANADFAATTLLSGNFVKRLGNGAGVVVNDNYTLTGGIIEKIPDTKNNTSGDTEQGTTTYSIFFSNVTTGIQ